METLHAGLPFITDYVTIFPQSLGFHNKFRQESISFSLCSLGLAGTASTAGDIKKEMANISHLHWDSENTEPPLPDRQYLPTEAIEEIKMALIIGVN